MSSRLETAINAVAASQGAAAYTTFGQHKKDARTVPPRVAWVFLRFEDGFPEQQEDAEADDVCQTSLAVCSVYLWGNTFEVAEQLYHEFKAALFNALGETVFRATSARPAPENTPSSLGFELILEVGIKFPIYSEQNTRHTIATTVLGLQLEDAKGENPEAA